jgi:hypothetical protein
MARNGAPYTGEYIKKYISQQVAGALFETFSENRSLLMDMIAKLPLVCKNATAYATYSTGKAAYFTVQNLFSSFFNSNTSAVPASEDNGNYEEQTAKKYIEEAVQFAAAMK